MGNYNCRRWGILIDVSHHAVALVDGAVREDAAELMDMNLMNAVDSEAKRQRLVSLLKNRSRSLVFSKNKLLEPFSATPKSFFTKVTPWKPCESERAIDHVINQAVSFIHTLEAIRNESLPQHRTRLKELAKPYGLSPDNVEDRFLKYDTEFKKADKRRKKLEEDIGQSQCPRCNTVGRFKMTQQYLTRNQYRCTECQQATLLCRMPKCSNMTINGDFWSDELCEAHSVLGVLSRQDS